MKKLYSIILVLALLLPVLASCQSTPPATDQTTPPTITQTPTDTEATPAVQTLPVTTDPITAQLTRDEAIAIALKDAGLQKDQVYDLNAELDTDNGILHYDVDFEKDNEDYDYEIDAATGEILKKEMPKDNTKKSSASSSSNKKQLTKTAARDIALKHAGFSVSQVQELEVELDRDDGTLHYDVDFEKDGYDYDYEIDATTGNILKSKKERD